ncbi:MAG: phosphoribosylaminoimidazolesuccinocarboxamide synthase [Planctomycetota bacterium]
MSAPVVETDLPGLPCQRGKVRDVYDLGDRLLLVSTDRISAFDWVLPTPIPDKGRVLTLTSNFWFDRMSTPHHLLETEVQQMDLPDDIDRAPLAGRAVMVRKTEVVPIECVVRGYLAGSAWREYQSRNAVCGIPLPAGLAESERLPTPIFTPATKAAPGEHDENIPFADMERRIGQGLAQRLQKLSLDLYSQGAAHALRCGIVLADTKFEFGLVNGEILLIDEVMTPDSSRFWPADQYEPGRSQKSFDKQFVRDWLAESDWDKNSRPPELPGDIVRQTRQKYIEAYERISSEKFGWT